MIEALKGFPTNVLVFSWKGHVTKHDHETVLILAVEGALNQQGKVRLYCQIDADFHGFEYGAIWDDFKVGTEHLLRWERIAVVTDLDWVGFTFRAFSFAIPAVAKIFRIDEKAKARKWILEDMTR
jgi:hypothetical protein